MQDVITFNLIAYVTVAHLTVINVAGRWITT